MRLVYETIDGKQFNEKSKALAHEKSLDKKALERINILKKESPFTGMNELDEYYVEVSRDYDSGANPKGMDILKGNKKDLINFIAYNNKYWYMRGHWVRLYKDKTIEVKNFLKLNNKEK